MKNFLLLLFLSFFLACTSLPEQKLSQYKMDLSYEVEGDSLRITMANPLSCPLRMNARSQQESVKQLLEEDFPFILPPKTDTSFSYPTSLTRADLQLKFSGTFGNPADSIVVEPLVLPFPKGYSYKIIQGHNGSFSHQSAYSRYAVDFGLSIGDTVCAAADGYVVGMIEGYEHGGGNKRWRDYANFITLFHPDLNLYTQYVHLTHQGSFVEVGDRVEAGTPIGLSGMTGFTDISHLHFNVLRATEGGMDSYPMDFVEGYTGSDLNNGDRVKR